MMKKNFSTDNAFQRTNSKVKKLVDFAPLKSYGTKLIKKELLKSTSQPINTKESFVPFCNERGTGGKILPSVNTQNSRSFKKLQTLETYKRGKKIIKAKLVSSKQLGNPGVGTYNYSSMFDIGRGKHPGFYSPQAERSNKVSENTRSTDFVDVTSLYKGVDRHYPVVHFDKGTGRQTDLYSHIKKHRKEDLLNSKLPDLYKLPQPKMADLDKARFSEVVKTLTSDINTSLTHLKQIKNHVSRMQLK